jgi:hypothetical protein
MGKAVYNINPRHCEMCELTKRDFLLMELMYQDKILTITHFVVYNRHRKKPTKKHFIHIRKIVGEFFPPHMWQFRGRMRSSLGHWHDHIIPRQLTK